MNRRKLLTSGMVLSLCTAMGVFAGCSVNLPNGSPIVEILPPAPIIVQPLPPAPPPQQEQPADTQLQQIVAPIALYPDPLLAQVLTAATYPDQIQAADQWLQANPSPTDAMIDMQNWDPSIKSLVRYPTVLDYMSSNIDWTQSLGAAFANQQSDVMAAIQDDRAQAQQQGNLASNDQQEVETSGSTIYIQPADPSVMFIPTYDPVLVYTQYSPVTFVGVGYPIGVWLNYSFDWDSGVVFVGDWHEGWFHDPRYGWYRDPHYYPHYDHPWAHDNRWGRAPEFHGYHVPHDMVGREWHTVPAHYGTTHYQGQTHYNTPSYNEPGNHSEPGGGHPEFGGGLPEYHNPGSPVHGTPVTPSHGGNKLPPKKKN